MRTTRGTTSIIVIPGKLDGTHQMAFYRGFESCINLERPKVVLDCSMLPQLDLDCIYLLLCCLEQAMKCNGDVRLAALRPRARSVLKSAGLDLILQAFESVDEAVESFRAQPTDLSPGAMTEMGGDQVQTSAA